MFKICNTIQTYTFKHFSFILAFTHTVTYAHIQKHFHKNTLSTCRYIYTHFYSRIKRNAYACALVCICVWLCVKVYLVSRIFVYSDLKMFVYFHFLLFSLPLCTYIFGCSPAVFSTWLWLDDFNTYFNALSPGWFKTQNCVFMFVLVCVCVSVNMHSMVAYIFWQQFYVRHHKFVFAADAIYNAAAAAVLLLLLVYA